MNKYLITTVLVCALLLSACANRGTVDGVHQNNTPATPQTTEATPATPTQPAPSNAGDRPASEHVNENYQHGHPLYGLEHNLYAGIQMTASVLPRNSIHSGSTIPVTVTVSNTGNKTVVYTQGSNRYETPEALYVHTEGLQPIIARDWLGTMTMDYASRELKPGETLTFTTHVRAIEPHGSFNEYTHARYSENQAYIGDIEWNELYGYHNELVGAGTGTYRGHIAFRYYVVEDGQPGSAGQEPTGYARADFTIKVDGNGNTTTRNNANNNTHNNNNVANDNTGINGRSDIVGNDTNNALNNNNNNRGAQTTPPRT